MVKKKASEVLRMVKEVQYKLDNDIMLLYNL